MSAYDWDVYARGEPTQVHATDCEEAPEKPPTGDANAEVLHDPERYARENETIDVSCACLDDVLDPDRRDSTDG